MTTSSSSYVPTELGTRPVGRLLMQYAIPAIIAMTASSLLNIVDRSFIGHIAPDGAWGVGSAHIVSGLSVTFPFMNLSAAFGAMVGVGASTVLSVRLGQKDYPTAQRILGNAVSLNVVLGVAFAAVCLLFIDPILRLFGASDATIPYARIYMQVLLVGNVITHLYLGLNALIRAAGHPRQAMLCTFVAVIANAILDPLFIFVFRWGIAGAAIATVLAQALAFAWQLKLLSRPTELVHLRRGIYAMRPRIIWQILAVGLSPFLMNACACLVVILINRSMMQYGGDAAIGAYGIVNSVAFFFLMIVIGFNQGMQPIVGYNWGAHQNRRVWQTLKYTVVCGVAVTTLGFLFGEFMPDVATAIITSNPDIMPLSERGFRICVCAFPLVGCQMVIGNFFQSIGHAAKSIFISLTRQLLFLIPFLLILPRYLGLDGVWLSLPASDVISFCIAQSMLWWLYNKHFRKAE